MDAMNILKDDVIAAISTPMGSGGIGIVRLSGKGADGVAGRIVRARSGQRVEDFESGHLVYGDCVDPSTGDKVDEVLVSLMRAPKTYTREDVVEINCHGGPLMMRRILELTLEAGARLAEPGEFTERAFLNGRIDLSQAEAVMDIIDAKTEKSLAYSVGQLSGVLSQKYNRMDETLLHLLTYIEAAIDYPEYDVEEVTDQTLEENLTDLMAQVETLLTSARMGKIYRDGVDTVILGEPNVGKSSLLNRLIDEDKALVTDIPGTTRDMVEEYINIKGIPFHIMDTAGIRQTDNVVEKMGVDKAMDLVDKADLILFITDVSRETFEDEKRLEQRMAGKTVIRIRNKIDLAKDDGGDVGPGSGQEGAVSISVKEDVGIGELEQAMADAVMAGEPDSPADTVVSNTRHIVLLKKVRDDLTSASQALAAGMTVDLIAIDLKNALDHLREITGKSVGSDIIDSIFANFCLGK